MTKELLTIEFRYHEVPKSEHSCEYVSKTITIGVYDTLEEAVKEGNKVLKDLSSKFRFSETFGVNNGLWGTATRLVWNYSQCEVEVFCEIERLNFDDNISKVMNEVFESEEEYRKWKDNNN